jgi:hypothetical protein
MFGQRDTPSTTHSDGPYRALVVVLLPGMMKEFAGLEGPTWLNFMAELSATLGTASEALNDAILNSQNDTERINLVERYLCSHLHAGWRQSFCAPARISH